MKLLPIVDCRTDVRVRTTRDGDPALRVKLGPMTFELTEAEGVALASTIADAVTRLRTATGTGQ